MKMFVVAVVLSILGLALGPFFAAVGARSRGATAALDGLTLGVVPALVVTHLVPHLYDEIGIAAPLLMIAGYAGFWFLEKRGAHDVGAALVVPTLAIHSLFDGAALALAFAERASGRATAVLGFALIAHRLPEGLFIGATFVPRFGLWRTFKRVAILGACTLAGAVGGRELVAYSPELVLHALIAIGLGVMVRLVIHRHAPPPAPRHAPIASLAFLVGIAIALLVPSPHDHVGIEWACVAVVATVLTGGLVRVGPRTWFRSVVVPPAQEPSHEHHPHEVRATIASEVKD